MLTRLDESCLELDRRVRQAFLASREAQLLETILGVGELTAVALVAELCRIDRFPNIEKLCSYAGLVPATTRAERGRIRVI